MGSQTLLKYRHLHKIQQMSQTGQWERGNGLSHGNLISLPKLSASNALRANSMEAWCSGMLLRAPTTYSSGEAPSSVHCRCGTLVPFFALFISRVAPLAHSFLFNLPWLLSQQIYYRRQSRRAFLDHWNWLFSAKAVWKRHAEHSHRKFRWRLFAVSLKARVRCVEAAFRLPSSD